MENRVEKHFRSVLHHLYINPLEKCNLNCKICYTKKTAPILNEEEITGFIDRYNRETEVKVITFCGGEVHALPYFPGMVNKLTRRGIFVQVITNGTIDRLGEYETPNSINMIVSVDGPEEHHDANRGEGRFKESMGFLEKAKKMGFHFEVFTVVTRDNLNRLDEFEKYVSQRIGEAEITYHPRKPLDYLNIHPVSNGGEREERFGFLTIPEMRQLARTRRVFPPLELGCYQVALVSDGTVYGCCEGFDPIGKISDPPEKLIANLQKRIAGPCLGCSQPAFMCGVKELIEGSNR